MIISAPIVPCDLEKHLERAIESDQMSLYYQPQIDINNQQIIGVEALVRWIHPEWGVVPPSSFIPLAEENGLIVQLGLWVLREGCMANHRFAALGLPPLPVSINVSPLQLNSPVFLSDLYRIIKETNVNTRLLELEITESAAIERVNVISRKLREVREMGIRMAIDDFGAGLSNYHRLRRLPVDRLKIDRSFIRDIHTDDNQRFVVSAIIRLAKRIGMEVIVEGVEQAEQERALLEIGCCYAQGFRYGHPMTRSQWAEYYARHLGLNLYSI